MNWAVEAQLGATFESRRRMLMIDKDGKISEDSNNDHAEVASDTPNTYKIQDHDE